MLDFLFLEFPFILQLNVHADFMFKYLTNWKPHTGLLVTLLATEMQTAMWLLLRYISLLIVSAVHSAVVMAGALIDATNNNF